MQTAHNTQNTPSTPPNAPVKDASSSLEKLNTKVEAIVAKVKNTQSHNSELINEIAELKANGEKKDGEISRLQEESAMKDLEIEEITKMIEEILG